MKDVILLGDALTRLKDFKDCMVDMCVTSPPYYTLRDYGVEGQIGLEQTPEEYINRLADVFDEVRRVLKDDGTLWVNIGDSYAHNKNLIGVPWMLAFELRKRGWYLRQDIIWAKANCMPESVKDRCTKAHEYMFLLSKSPKYYFDYEAIQEPCKDVSVKRAQYGFNTNHPTAGKDGIHTTKMGERFVPKSKNCQYKGQTPHSFHISREMGEKDKEYYVRNKRDVWFINMHPTKEAHFATFPPDLIKPCILAGCPEGGIVLDPFMGSGTTALVAKRLWRKYIGIELNPEYKALAERRIYAMGNSLFD